MSEYITTRDFENGLRAGVVELIMGTGRICVGPIKSWNSSYSRGY